MAAAKQSPGTEAKSLVLDLGAAFREKRSELEAVLHSKEFYRASSLAKLLEYLCEKSITGHTAEIKEFSIATEVFGKDLDFGEKRDAFVRVAVHRLRRKLNHYYDTEGAAHSLRILIKPGKYEPEFERVSEVAANPVAQDAPAALPHRTSLEQELPEFSPIALPVTGPPSWWRRIAIAFGAILLALLAVRLWLERNTGRGAPTESNAAAERPSLAPAGYLQTVRIMAGSSADRISDRFGAEWRGDRFFAGGYKDSLRLGTQERSVGHPFILGAADQTPFRSFRAGSFAYRIPLAPGKYELRLYFSEVVFGIGPSGEGGDNQRLFDVNLNGSPLLTQFDIFSEAGASNTADIRVFENVSAAADGYLTLDFKPVREAAWLNAIELIPNASGRMQPLRILAQDSSFVDHTGTVWGSDRFYLGGRIGSDGKVPAGISDPGLFTNSRYGHFSYRLPAAPGKYRLRLLFAESFFGPDNRGKGGVGSRVFNVYCGGTTLLRNFDIFQTAGENRAVVKVFHGIEPNPAGQIDLTFEPVVNYAIVQAIELTAEGH